MTQADRMLSMPPTNTPISQNNPADATSRRRFLTNAAGAAAGSAVLALGTLQPVAAMTAPVVAAAPAPEDPAIVGLGERIEPLLVAYRSAGADRLEARARAEATCPAVPDELTEGHFPGAYVRDKRDVEDRKIQQSGVSEYGHPLRPRQILDPEATKAAIARGNICCNRRTKFGKALARRIEIAERYEKEREAAIGRSGLFEAWSRQREAAYEIEKLAYEACDIEPQTMAGALIQARACCLR
jgi:hypothetical protein